MFAKNRHATQVKWNGCLVHLNVRARKWNGLHADKWLTDKKPFQMILIECAYPLKLSIVDAQHSNHSQWIRILCISYTNAVVRECRLHCANTSVMKHRNCYASLFCRSLAFLPPSIELAVCTLMTNAIAIAVAISIILRILQSLRP